jgi:hypothetical protein
MIRQANLRRRIDRLVYDLYNLTEKKENHEMA